MLNDYEWAKSETLTKATKKWTKWKNKMSSEYIICDDSQESDPKIYSIWISQ